MKRSSEFRKTASNLSDSVHQQLNKYALAAGAAGVSLLVLAAPSEAKIVYTKANVTIGNGGVNSYNLDFNHDGIVDLIINTIKDGHKCGADCFCIRRRIWETPASSNGVELGPLSEGSRIGHSQRFYGGQMLMASSNYLMCNSHKGPWWSISNRYLGMKFKIHKKIHYGWARLTFDRGRAATLPGYAYETIPGKSIIAGKTHGPENEWEDNDVGPGASLTNPIPDTPEPASLSMLALGAQGVPLWRRKESVLCIS